MGATPRSGSNDVSCPLVVGVHTKVLCAWVSRPDDGLMVGVRSASALLCKSVPYPACYRSFADWRECAQIEEKQERTQCIGSLA